jgi:predicted MFS family arabinose efflux permease
VAVLTPSHDTTRSPFAEPTFRELWGANLVSNIGTWMQTVAGAWLMTTLTPNALPVALMQTATTLPSLVLGLPAGSLADRVDRRRLLLLCQLWMLLCAALLSVLTVLGLVNPWLLLGLTFALGVGSVLNAPTWSAIVPEVVSRAQVPTAISLNSAGYNVSRAVGPAIGGFVVAIAGAAAAFMLNAVSFLATVVAVWRWRPAARPDRDLATHEAFLRTIQVGLRYAWTERRQRVVLLRSTLWMLCASALWGLLPLVAIHELGLDATGYGLLVTFVGGGAVAGSLALPRARRRWPTNRILISSIVTFTVMLLVMAWVRWLPLVCVMLALGGAAWTTSNQNFQIAVQLGAPRRLQARAIAAYLLTFQGGLAVGSALWGTVAQRAGDPAALTGAAVGMAIGTLAAVRWPVKDEN